MKAEDFNNLQSNEEISASYHWRIIKKSVAGTSHKKLKQTCQDACQSIILANNVLIATVADGAGSADFGALGAKIAVRTVIKTAKSNYSSYSVLGSSINEDFILSILSKCVEAAFIALEKEANNRAIEIQSLATTLILLVATPDIAATLQIGDGGVIVGDPEGNIIDYSTPQNGEYINQTTFLTSPNALAIANQSKKLWRGVKHIAMLSDGLQMIAYKLPQGTPYEPFFLPLFRFIATTPNVVEGQKQLNRFLNSKRVKERTDDDLTLLLATFTQ